MSSHHTSCLSRIRSSLKFESYVLIYWISPSTTQLQQRQKQKQTHSNSLMLSHLSLTSLNLPFVNTTYTSPSQNLVISSQVSHMQSTTGNTSYVVLLFFQIHLIYYCSRQ